MAHSDLTPVAHVVCDDKVIGWVYVRVEEGGNIRLLPEQYNIHGLASKKPNMKVITFELNVKKVSDDPLCYTYGRNDKRFLGLYNPGT